MHISEGPPRGKRMTDSCTKAGQGTRHHPSRGGPWGLALARWLSSATPPKQTQAGPAALQDPRSSPGTPRRSPAAITQQGPSAVPATGLPSPGQRRPPLSTCLHPLQHPHLHSTLVPFSGEGLDADPSLELENSCPSSRITCLLGSSFIFSKGHWIAPPRNMFMYEALKCGAVIFEITFL